MENFMNDLELIELQQLGGLLYLAYHEGDGYNYLAVRKVTRQLIDHLTSEREQVLLEGFIQERETMFSNQKFDDSDHVETFWAMYDELPIE
ncbi:hypothetical protein LD13_gp202 [Bacillus phage Bobb]|uniref:Uncharacterized protein n=1 Tax=Bacillus phage Bobb TaxID=1527469 RepID=A0A076G752_9CAUD|nr:hypothetical protein LD13_gp005 [Bacillus phage Bobb]YP_009056515.1 hypothetical protein LD13_gp202 [Bacillus phage Bobb]AII27906.1 hypothetical protein [Bacillus phage Bobb]AII28147.1 hypothetical protein [Bacillus phage Bobb]